MAMSSVRHEFATSHEHVAIAVKTFGAFAEDHEIHGFAGEPHAHAGLGWPDVCEEVEFHAKLARRIDASFFTRRIIKMGDGPEYDSGRFAGCLHDVVRQGRAALFKRTQTDRFALPFEAEFVARVRAVEDAERGIGNFGADAVAG